MSKVTDEWSTPDAFMELVKRKLGVRFSLDAAAIYNNAKAIAFLTGPHKPPPADCHCGLCADWFTAPDASVWLNSPYSNLGQWVEKAAKESMTGIEVVQLALPSVGSRWFREWVWPYAAEVIFLYPRIDFDGTIGSNMRDSMLIVWKPYVRVGPLRFDLWCWKEELR